VDAGAVDGGIGDAQGTDLPVGNLVRVGAFTVPESVVASNRYNVAFLQTNFVEFGTTTIGAGIAPAVPAHFASSLAADTSTLGIEGQRIYLWVFNATTRTAATQHAILTSSNAAWVFPSELPVPGSTLIDIAQTPTNNVLVGGYGLGTSDYYAGISQTVRLYNLQILPWETWGAGIFGTNRFNPAIGGKGADPDGDGLVNLLEYAFGSSPTNRGSASRPSSALTNKTAYITFGRATNALDVTWRVEVTSNFLSWATLRTVTVTNAPVAAPQFTVLDTNATTPVRAYRIRVEAP
jgi:hypothetical protein